MARYIVTGGCGFIGSHLVERLLAARNEVTVLDDLSTGRRENLPSGVRLVEGDVADRDLVASLMPGHQGCFHLAAIASVEKSREEWMVTNRTNLVGSIAVFDAARSANAGSPIPVVYASSAAVYGANTCMPLDETARTAPLSAYGADKLACELHAAAGFEVHGLATTGFRFFNVYGPRQDPKSPYSGVISIFSDLIRARRSLTIFGDGEQTRDFVYVGDVVSALVAAMDRPAMAARVFNVCTGRSTSINSLAQTLADLTGAPLSVAYAPPRAGDIRQSLGSPAWLHSELGVSCDVTLAQGLRTTLDWLSGPPSELLRKQCV